MKEEIQLKYTEQAIKRLEQLRKDHLRRVERLIRERKYVPGESLIEATASDVEQAARYIRVIHPKRSEIRRMILYTYIILGIAMVFTGLFYSQFREIFFGNPVQAMLVVVGATLVFASFILSRLLKIREERYRHESKNQVDEINR